MNQIVAGYAIAYLPVVPATEGNKNPALATKRMGLP